METTLNSANATVIELTNDMDTPMERLKLCFPNIKNYDKELLKYYRDYARVYLSDTHKMTIREIQDKITSKGKISSLELDILIIDLIEIEFRVEVEMKYYLSEDAISGLTVEECLDTTKSVEKLAVVKTELEDVKESSMYRSGSYDKMIKVKHLSHYE